MKKHGRLIGTFIPLRSRCVFSSPVVVACCAETGPTRKPFSGFRWVWSFLFLAIEHVPYISAHVHTSSSIILFSRPPVRPERRTAPELNGTFEASRSKLCMER
jgi:hypothetical protein